MGLSEEKTQIRVYPLSLKKDPGCWTGRIGILASQIFWQFF
jgi:hypothetical protein